MLVFFEDNVYMTAVSFLLASDVSSLTGAIRGNNNNSQCNRQHDNSCHNNNDDDNVDAELN